MEPLATVGAKGNLFANAQIKVRDGEHRVFELVALRLGPEAVQNFDQQLGVEKAFETDEAVVKGRLGIF